MLIGNHSPLLPAQPNETGLLSLSFLRLQVSVLTQCHSCLPLWHVFGVHLFCSISVTDSFSSMNRKYSYHKDMSHFVNVFTSWCTSELFLVGKLLWLFMNLFCGHVFISLEYFPGEKLLGNLTSSLFEKLPNHFQKWFPTSSPTFGSQFFFFSNYSWHSIFISFKCAAQWLDIYTKECDC